MNKWIWARIKWDVNIQEAVDIAYELGVEDGKKSPGNKGLSDISDDKL